MDTPETTVQTDQQLADRLAGATGPLRVLHLLADEQVSIRDVAEAVESDDELGRRLLRIARSPLYGITATDITVGRAVVLLGLTTVRNLAVISACEHLALESGVDHTDFWDHALLVGVVAERLAERVDADAEDAFMAGLLHDVGELMLMEHHAGYQADVLDRVGGTPEQVETEQSLYGTDHVGCAVGVLSAGPFTPEMIGAIRHHHDRVLTTRSLLDRVVASADRVAQQLRRIPRAPREEMDAVLREAALTVQVDNAMLVEIRRGHEALRLSLGS